MRAFSKPLKMENKINFHFLSALENQQSFREKKHENGALIQTDVKHVQCHYKV